MVFTAPELPPADRTDLTPSAGNHAQDHNLIADALQAIVDHLEAAPDPEGGALPAGSVLYARKAGSSWPDRPTNRTDILVVWIGAEPSPPVTAPPSVLGMYEGDARDIPAT